MPTPLLAAARDIAAGLTGRSTRERAVAWAALFLAALRRAANDPEIRTAALILPELPDLVADEEPSGWTGNCAEPLRGLALLAQIELSAAAIAEAIEVNPENVARWLSLPPQHSPTPWPAWAALRARVRTHWATLASVGGGPL